MKIITFEEIISIENLFYAWGEFINGKKHKKDVMDFSVHLSENMYNLHHDLKNGVYLHGGYHAFNISDPKPRNIHKATVRDRLLHHAIYRVLYPLYDTKFIYDSYSCRDHKGTHRALRRFEEFGRKASFNNTKTVWVLKCDVKKFFASIDQDILMQVLSIHITDKKVLRLMEDVIGSFESTRAGKGLPLGNLTSQLFVNIYMDWFDQYMKHRLEIRYYIRYADDFVIMNADKSVLENILKDIQSFLKDRLSLDLHPDKVFIKTFSSGVDFLGWMHFADHRVLRTVSKKRMFRNIKIEQNNKQTLQSYLGLLSHGNARKLRRKILPDGF
ncbi:MAG: reverse transcriptase domain-containing protein [Minisyncoccota bacterium]